MSGEPKPLALTLEEAMVVLLDAGLRFVYFGSTHWSVKTVALGHYKGTGLNWWTAATRALGYEVAPRDDAAELRAQVSRLQEALAFAQSVIKSGERWSPTCDEVIGGALATHEEQP